MCVYDPKGQFAHERKDFQILSKLILISQRLSEFVSALEKGPLQHTQEKRADKACCAMPLSFEICTKGLKHYSNLEEEKYVFGRSNW